MVKWGKLREFFNKWGLVAKMRVFGDKVVHLCKKFAQIEKFYVSLRRFFKYRDKRSINLYIK